jgi:hypothetical protein
MKKGIAGLQVEGIFYQKILKEMRIFREQLLSELKLVDDFLNAQNRKNGFDWLYREELEKQKEETVKSRGRDKKKRKRMRQIIFRGLKSSIAAQFAGQSKVSELAILKAISNEFNLSTKHRQEIFSQAIWNSMNQNGYARKKDDKGAVYFELKSIEPEKQ